MKWFEFGVLFALTLTVESLVPDYYELNIRVHPRYHNKSAIRIKYLANFTSVPTTRLTRISGIYTYLKGDYIPSCDRIGYNPHYCNDNLHINQNSYDSLEIMKQYEDTACVRRPSEIFGFIQNITLDVCGLPMKGPMFYHENFLRTFYVFWQLELHGYYFDIDNNMYRKLQNDTSACTLSSIGFDAPDSFARIGGLFNTDSRNAFVNQIGGWVLYDHVYDVCAFSNETTKMWYWRKSCFVYDAMYDGSKDVPFYNVTSGVNFTYVNWAPGEPKMYGCIAIKGEVNYYWYAVPCTFEFIREDDPTRVDIIVGTKPDRYAFVCDIILPPATVKTMHGTIKVTVQAIDTPVTLTTTIMKNKTNIPTSSSNASKTTGNSTASSIGTRGLRQLAKGSQAAASITSVISSGSMMTTFSVSTTTLSVEYASMVFECDNDDNYGLGVGSDPAQSELASNKEIGATIFNLVISVGWFIIYYFFDRQRNNENTPGMGLFGFYYFLQPWTYCGIRLLNTPGEVRYVGVLPLLLNAMFYSMLAYVYKKDLYLTKNWKALFSHRFKPWCLIEIPTQVGFSLVAGFPAGSEKLTCELQAVAIAFLSIVHLVLLLWLKPFPYDVRGNIEGAMIGLVDVLVCAACILAVTDDHVVSSSLMILGDYLLIAASLVPLTLQAFIGMLRLKEYYQNKDREDALQDDQGITSSPRNGVGAGGDAAYVAIDASMDKNKIDIEMGKVHPTVLNGDGIPHRRSTTTTPQIRTLDDSFLFKDIPPPLPKPPLGRGGGGNTNAKQPPPRPAPKGIAL